MKKRIIAAILALMTVFSFTGCSDNDGTVVISERFFVHELQEVVFNYQQYLGRTIQLQGMFRTWNIDGVDRFLVMRYTQDCCGAKPVGMEVVLEDFSPFADDTWVEAEGILAIINGFLVIQVTSITEPARRGAEVV